MLRQLPSFVVRHVWLHAGAQVLQRFAQHGHARLCGARGRQLLTLAGGSPTEAGDPVRGSTMRERQTRGRRWVCTVPGAAVPRPSGGPKVVLNKKELA